MHVQFAGDRTEWNEKVAAALHDALDRRDFLGMAEVALSYTAGRGYQIVSAQLHVPGVAAIAPGDPLPQAELRDYSAEVRTILQRIGAPLA